MTAISVTKAKILVCFLLILILTGCNAQRNDLSERAITTEDVNALVETKTIFKYSTEGAELTGIYSDDHELQYLYVDILGEMGRITREYTFLEDRIIYNCHEVMYEQPFYIEKTLKIAETNDTRYLITEDELYILTYEGEWAKMSEEDKVEEKEMLQEFLDDFASEEE